MKGFAIPNELAALIAESLWPSRGAPVDGQISNPLISSSAVRKFAPEESTIILFPPPFSTVRKLMEGGEKKFWLDPRMAINEIDPDRTLLIGDFGLGSDAPIALDYRKSEIEPRVIRLHWASDGNHWVEIAPSFGAFSAYFKNDFTRRASSLDQPASK